MRASGAAGAPGRAARRGRDGVLLGAGLVLGVVLGVWLKSSPPAPAPVAARAVPPPAPPTHAPAPPEPARVVRPVPVPEARSSGDEAHRRLLRAALAARAEELAACAGPAPLSLPVRLTLSPKGRLSRVQFASAEPVPTEVAACVRARMAGWQLGELARPEPQELVLTLSLGTQ